MNYTITTKTEPNRIYIDLQNDTIETRVAFIDDLLSAANQFDKFYFIIYNEKDPIKSLEQFKATFPSDEAFNAYMGKHKAFMEKVILLVSVRDFEMDRQTVMNFLGRPATEEDKNFFQQLGDRNVACYTVEMAEEIVQRHLGGKL